MADLAKVRSEYVAGLQAASQKLVELSAIIDGLADLYVGSALSGTFTDQELLADVTSKHMDAAFISTITGNLATVKAAITNTFRQNAAKCVGKRVI